MSNNSNIQQQPVPEDGRWLFVGPSGVLSKDPTIASQSVNSEKKTVEVKQLAPTVKLKLFRGLSGNRNVMKPLVTWIGSTTFLNVSAVSLTTVAFAIQPTYSVEFTSLATIYDEFKIDEVRLIMDTSPLNGNGAGASTLAIAYDMDGVVTPPSFAQVCDYQNALLHITDGAHAKLSYKAHVAAPEVTSSSIILPPWQDCNTASSLSYGTIVFANVAKPTTGVSLYYVIRLKCSFRSRR
jgi:hypothetical protein